MNFNCWRFSSGLTEMLVKTNKTEKLLQQKEINSNFLREIEALKRSAKTSHKKNNLIHSDDKIER